MQFCFIIYAYNAQYIFGNIFKILININNFKVYLNNDKVNTIFSTNALLLFIIKLCYTMK